MSTVIDDVSEHESRQKFQVVVMYNGVKKEIEIDPKETVKALLDRAICTFGSLPNPHTLALFTKEGVELTNEQQSIREAGIRRHDHLLLRPSAVKGG